MIQKVAMMGAFALAASLSLGAQDVAHAVDGTVKKIDTGTKTVVVETKDGTEHTFDYAGDMTVDGAKGTEKGAKGSLKGIEVGSKVAVHYTTVGGKDTAHEVDKIGDDGLKATEGTVTEVGKGGKTIAVKTADGTVETFHLTKRATTDSGKDVAKAADKSAKVTVYYTEDAGKKTAHFVSSVF